jgi:hypothetical protein
VNSLKDGIAMRPALLKKMLDVGQEPLMILGQISAVLEKA